MKIALIDVDGHNFPNIPLMKLSAKHKAHGDSVEWYEPLFSKDIDICYMSKVFTFTPDYDAPVNAGKVIKGGTGYSYPDGGMPLDDEVDHVYPDYSIYYERIPETRNTAYGFLTRGCPRGCDFCVVKEKEGARSVKVADLSEFWRGQKNIVLLDPNMFACKDWRNLAGQLIDSGAYVDFSQGCDIRIMTEEMAVAIRSMRIRRIHFAWDRYSDKDFILPKLKMFKNLTGWSYERLGVYVLTNFNTTHEQDLERVEMLKEMGFNPYVMIYDKEKLPAKHVTRRLQRWCNNRRIFRSVPFSEYRGGVAYDTKGFDGAASMLVP